MNRIQKKLTEIDKNLANSFEKAYNNVSLLLQTYKFNFPSYTDHSIEHTNNVFNIASDIITDSELNNLNQDELYVLSMACILHDVGMCIPPEKISEIQNTTSILEYRNAYPEKSNEDYIRDIHHELSEKFILEEWESLFIPSEIYAEAIGLVAKGHRKVKIDDFEIYKTKFFVKTGRDFVCLPYITSLLRIADELDVTNSRTPEMLTKYYWPNNEKSIVEYNKHISTIQRNITEDYVKFTVKCGDHNTLAALETQFEKIKDVLLYCQRVIKNIANTADRRFELSLTRVLVEYKYTNNFNPQLKGIKYSLNVPNVVNSFIGEDLYGDKLTSVREAIQNSIDACNYKLVLFKNSYVPKISISISNDKIEIQDNGLGMDLYVIENFFGRLGSSFYEESKIKDKFQAIGQFGVGVFSYFLICDFVDIETKKEDEESYKFRIDKNSNNYFHFFDQSTRKDSGTTTTLYLKSEVSKNYTPNNISDYIENIFRYIDFPINVITPDKNITITSRKFSMENDFILKRLKHHLKHLTNEYCIKEVYINNNDIEGNCFVILKQKEKLESITSDFDRSTFESVHSITSSQISFSQKGVFVNNYSSNILDMMFGSINVKKKLRINIDRNQFSSYEDVSNILSLFEEKLTSDIFSSYIKPNKKSFSVSNDYLENYLTYYYNIEIGNKKDFFKHKICNLLTTRINLKTKIKYDKITNIFENYSSLFIISSKYEEGLNILKSENVPFIVYNSYKIFKFFERVLPKLFDYNLSIEIFENLPFFCYSNNEKYKTKQVNFFNPSYSINYCYSEKLFLVLIVKSNSDIHDYGATFLNYNHPLINIFQNYAKEIEANNEILNSVLSFTGQFFENILSGFEYDENLLISEEKINQFNTYLQPIKKIKPLDDLTIADFMIKS